MTIRKATIEDLPILLGYEQDIVNTERPFDPTLAAGIIHYYDIEKMIHDDNTRIVVAEEGGKVVASGYARIQKAEPFLDHKEYAHLGFMFVHPDHRGRGLNAKIIASLKGWVVSRNITEIRLEVYFDNQAAIRAYEKIGFVKHMLIMRLQTEPNKLNKKG